MRKIVTEAYKINELDHDAFERAHEQYTNNMPSDDYVVDEVMDSLKELFKKCDEVTMTDWSLGAYNRGNRISVTFRNDDAGELTGPRAMAWLENNLLHDLRMPWHGGERWDVAQYGASYRPGKIKPCPLTGMCYDEDLLEDLQKSIKDGKNLKDAFTGLADTVATILEDEDEYQRTAEYFRETAEANEWEYTKEGRRI